MNFVQRIFHLDFFIRLVHWEYWPFGIVQAPSFLQWFWFSLRSGSIFFFSASNPGILMGGMFGESKFDVLEKIPAAWKPKTILIKLPTTKEDVLQRIREGGLTFPLIVKPDLGERGWMVKRMQDHHDLQPYLDKIKIDFLIQDLVDLPLEFGVFYVRYPDEEMGKVISITGKEMLSVRGDGKSSLQQLILNKPRAKLQWSTLRTTYDGRLQEIPAADKVVELVSIGNHCLGTRFINNNNLISEKLSAAFDALSKRIDGFYFGRFDVRTASLSDLEKAEVQVLELNGCGAEPAHIYDSGFSFWKALGVLFRHWNYIYRISVQNHERGVPYVSFQEGKLIYRKFKSLTA